MLQGNSRNKLMLDFVTYIVEGYALKVMGSHAVP